jgi:predicted DNA-binding antitoxin AbrB/MazE fold protein
MSTDNPIIPGIVKDGVIVPKSQSPLPEGTEVEIVIRDAAMTPELRDELAAWQAAGDEAWAMIDQWEKEDCE